MAKLQIETLDERTEYMPGETLEGIAGWEVDEIKSATIRLIWRTEGKGTQDVGLAEEQRFDSPASTDAQPFHFTLPAGPFSYDGAILAILWTLELEVQPGGHTKQLDLTLSPTGQKILGE